MLYLADIYSQLPAVTWVLKRVILWIGIKVLEKSAASVFVVG
jgi:hypothetical protein